MGCTRDGSRGELVRQRQAAIDPEQYIVIRIALCYSLTWHDLAYTYRAVQHPAHIVLSPFETVHYDAHHSGMAACDLTARIYDNLSSTPDPFP